MPFSDFIFANESQTKQDGYTLEILFPAPIPVQADPTIYQIHDDLLTVEGAVYRRLTLVSANPIFRGQTVQVLDKARHPVSYQMNDSLYRAAYNKKWLFRWAFFAGNLLPLDGAIQWDKMYEY